MKIHRSLVQDDEGIIYGATACLHSLSERLEGPGGKLFRYDPNTKALKILAIRVPYDYIQTIALDILRLRFGPLPSNRERSRAEFTAKGSAKKYSCKSGRTSYIRSASLRTLSALERRQCSVSRITFHFVKLCPSAAPSSSRVRSTR